MASAEMREHGSFVLFEPLQHEFYQLSMSVRRSRRQWRKRTTFNR